MQADQTTTTTTTTTTKSCKSANSTAQLLQFDINTYCQAVVPALVAGCSGLLQPTVGRDSGCQPHPHSRSRTSDVNWAAEVRGCTIGRHTPRR